MFIPNNKCLMRYILKPFEQSLMLEISMRFIRNIKKKKKLFQ